MRTISILMIIACLIGLGFSFKKKTDLVPELKMPGAKPVVVLELFTSEGCSSCPPAEDLLPILANMDSNIIPLSFHVDYWDRLGWKDPYSNPLFTNCQEEYAREFNVESIYTPQLVINGTYEVVGSNQAQAESSIRKALAEKATVELKIDDVKKRADKLTFTVKSEGDVKQTEIIAVLVQKKAITMVKAGENDGRKLTHINVVRSYIAHSGAKKINFELDFPEDLEESNSLLIVYTREKTHLHIVGAVNYKF